MLINILIALLILASIYWFIPSLWFRLISPRTIKTVSEDCVAITFDDGPSNVTVEVLNTLRGTDTKATFFVLGSFAKTHPEIIKQELAEGHQLALHGMNHKCHWFLGPKATFNDVKNSKAILQSLGGNPQYFRPPWGLYNIFTVIACRKESLNWVHWSLHTYDWSHKTTVDQRITTVEDKLKAGDVLLIHDGRGDDGAPEATSKALPEIIKVIKTNQLELCTLSAH